MAKVFMSILGVNCYVPAHYRLNGEVSTLTPFVQEAYLSITSGNWASQDRLVFFLTGEARRKNWEDHGNFPQGLYSRLKKLSLAAEIVAVPFNEEHTEEDIMQNFLTIVERLQEGDEVIFDITHSFRSLPMLNLVALNYARVLKGAEIKRIYYGAFEVLGHPSQVEEMPEEERVAPIFDLTPYVLLLDWTFAVEEFSRYGMAERLAELVQRRVGPVLRETRGRDIKASALRNFVNHLQGLTLNIYTCRCRDLMGTKIDEALPQGLSFDDFLPPFHPLLEMIEQKVSGFSGKDSWDKALAAVEWCLRHKLVQQGYTILEEAIISEVCHLLGFEDHYSRGDRAFVSSLLSVTAQKKPSNEWDGILGERKAEALELQRRGGEEFRALARVYGTLADLRNDINHCGCREYPRRARALAEELDRSYSDVVKAMRQLRVRLAASSDEG